MAERDPVVTYKKGRNPVVVSRSFLAAEMRKNAALARRAKIRPGQPAQIQGESFDVYSLGMVRIETELEQTSDLLTKSNNEAEQILEQVISVKSSIKNLTRQS